MGRLAQCLDKRHAGIYVTAQKADQDNRVVDPFGNPMENTLFLLPVTAMVLAAEEVELDAEPGCRETGQTCSRFQVEPESHVADTDARL